MAISYNSIPATLRVPWVYIEFSNERATQGSTTQPYISLLFGQKLDAGTAEVNVPIRITSDAQASNEFGAGSMLAAMVKSYRKSDSFTELYCIPQEDDPASAAAGGSIKLSGAATEAGTLYIYIGGVRVTAGVTATSSLAAIASGVAAVINANVDMPVIAEADADEVKLTCKWAGRTGNDIDIRFNYYAGEEMPAGLNASITRMSGGTSNPDISEALSKMGDSVHYNIICIPYSDGNNLRLLSEELDDRWGPLRQLEGLTFTSIRGTLSELSAFGNSYNTQHLCVVPATGTPNSPWEVAATAAALAAFYGNIDPGRPYQTLQMVGLLPPKIEDRFTLQERNLLLYDGVSTWIATEGGIIQAERFITTYKKSPAGGDDVSYLDIMTILTLGRLRYSLRNYLLNRYPRHKLASGDITQFGAGQSIATPDSIKGDIISWYQRMMNAALVEDMATFKAGLIVERNADDRNRVDILLTPDVVNALIIMAAKMEFIL